MLIFLWAGFVAIRFSILLVVIFFIAAFLFFSFFYIPDFMNVARIFVISQYGSREDQDLLSHFAELFFTAMLKGKISTQVNIADEDEMTKFAGSLVSLYAPDAVTSLLNYYPNIAEDYWKSNFQNMEDIEKETMRHVLFPEKYGGVDSPKLLDDLLLRFPFVDKSLLNKLIKWWKNFKAKMEWQDKMDGTQRS